MQQDNTTRAGDTEDQIVETERREPKDTVQGEGVE